MSVHPAATRAVIAALSLSLLMLADSMFLSPALPVVAASRAAVTPNEQGSFGAPVCAAGFVDVTSRSDMSLHGVALVPHGAIAVGYTRQRLPGQDGVRAPAVLVNQGGTWSREPVTSPGDEDGLMAVAWRKDAGAWAVGFTTINGQVKPLAMRWNGTTWKVDRPAMGGAVALFSDVDIVGDGRPLAVGYRMAGDGRRIPLVYRRDGPRWTRIAMPLGPHESISLVGVAAGRPGAIWVVGHGGDNGQVKPLIYERRDGKWKPFKLPSFKGEGVLTDVVSDGRAAWAVGYERRGGFTVPLVLRWNGHRWKRAKAPVVDSTDVLLRSVSTDPAGGIWVVGAAWDESRNDYGSLAAWWDGHSWDVTMGAAGGTELNAVAGSLRTNGWAVGRADGSARTVQVCASPASGVFGSTEPSPATSDDEATDALLAGADDPGYAEADDLESDEGDSSVFQRKPGRKPKGLKNPIGTLPLPMPDRTVFARDVARAAGVFEETGTYDAVVADFDGDGVDDLFIGRHGREGQLLLDRKGVFVEHEAFHMSAVDRHGCAAADVDGSGLPDLFCAVGGKRGSGLKANELWLDPGGSHPTEVGAARGLADPAGRGRLVAFLGTRDRRALQLVVTNSPTRVDGLPSVTRIYRTSGDGQFTERPGVATRMGARAIQSADFDGDGRDDLLLVTGGPQSPEPGSTRLYRNTRKGLVDVTSKMGIRRFDEFDAELVDLNGDKKLDLVQLSEIKLMVSLQKDGKFTKVFERNLTEGRALTSGDANGDGRPDLYLVRSSATRNYPDVMLLNREAGKRWSSVTIPQVSAGAGDDVFAIDHDGNGLDDFLVLNGHNLRGPTQLIAFYRR